MPYSIKVMENGNAEFIRARILEALVDSRFEATIEVVQTWLLELPRVRLKDRKEYCGNHPGECQVSPFGERPKKRTKFLEWDDWVEFHGIVNDVLDQHQVSADVWSKPQDAKGKFYMRRGRQRRHRYEWDARVGSFGREIRVWNLGTPDQFVQEDVSRDY